MMHVIIISAWLRASACEMQRLLAEAPGIRKPAIQNSSRGLCTDLDPWKRILECVALESGFCFYNLERMVLTLQVKLVALDS